MSTFEGGLSLQTPKELPILIFWYAVSKSLTSELHVRIDGLITDASRLEANASEISMSQYNIDDMIMDIISPQNKMKDIFDVKIPNLEDLTGDLYPFLKNIENKFPGFNLDELLNEYQETIPEQPGDIWGIKTKALGDYIKKIADRNHISMEETVKIIYGLESDSDRDDLLMQIPLAYFKKEITREWSKLTKVGWEWVFRVMLSKTVQELESQKFNGVECYSLCYFELAGKLMGDLGQILHCMKSGNVFASGDKLAVSQAMALNIINSNRGGESLPSIIYEKGAGTIGLVMSSKLSKKDELMMGKFGIVNQIPFNV